VELTDIERRDSPKNRYSRDYYIKASRSPTGEPSSLLPTRSTDSPVSVRSEASLEVSTILNGNSPLPERNDSSTFETLKRRTKNSLHFTNVFQTKAPSHSYGHYSLRLPAKHKRPQTSAFRKYNDDLKTLEKNSLLNDIKHSTIAARGASPNFVLNPVFELDQARKLERRYASSDRVSEEAIEPVFRSLSRNRTRRRERESGYGSTESVDSWRLTLSRTPEPRFRPIPGRLRPSSSLGTSRTSPETSRDHFLF